MFPFVCDRIVLFYTDFFHRQFVEAGRLSYPPMSEYVTYLEDSFLLVSLMLAMDHAAGFYVNTCPELQWTYQRLLVESSILGNKTICYLDLLRSSPSPVFSSVFIKWDELLMIDIGTVQTVYRVWTDTIVFAPTPDHASWHKEVFLYLHDSQEVRMGISIISCSTDDTPTLYFFDTAEQHNFGYKLYDFEHGRHYPTNLPIAHPTSTTLPVFFN